LKQQKLKIVLLFIHDTFSFEVWLSGYNKNVQTRYWKLFKENNWTKYPLAATPQTVDFITNHTLIENADFSNLDALTKQIETGTQKFIEDTERFLSAHKH
jgi:hypothetical protein